MRELEARFPDRLAVVGVHSAKYTTEGRDVHLRHAVRRLGIEHPVVNDNSMEIWQSYAVKAWPTLMFVSPDGRVLARHEGEFEIEAMAEAVAQIIEELETDGQFEPGAALQHHVTEDQPASAFCYPMAINAAGNNLYIADTGNHRVLHVSPDGRVIRTFGSGAPGFRDGSATEASFDSPHGMDLSDGMLYVADSGNHAIREIDLDSGEVSTVAGTGNVATTYQSRGPVQETSLRSPWDLVVAGGVIYIAMAGNHQIWTYRPGDAEISRYAGTGHEGRRDGSIRSSWLAQPIGINRYGDALVFSDAETSAVRTATLGGEGDGEVNTLVGKDLFDWGDVDGSFDDALLQHPAGVVADLSSGLIYVSDSYNNKIKVLDPERGEVRTIAGNGNAGHKDGPGAEAEFFEPYGLALAGRRLFVADTNNHAIRAVELSSYDVSTLDVRE